MITLKSRNGRWRAVQEADGNPTWGRLTILSMPTERASGLSRMLRRIGKRG